MAGNNEKTTRKGNNGNGFKPGQSGNPNGRPKTTPEQKDGVITIRWPKGVLPSRETIEKACAIMKAMKEAAA